MNRPQGRGATALEKHYAFLLWLLPTVEQFPRGQKFLLGDRMQTTALSILDALVEATYSRRPEAALVHANLRFPDPGMALLSGNMNGTKHERSPVARMQPAHRRPNWL